MESVKIWDAIDESFMEIEDVTNKRAMKDLTLLRIVQEGVTSAIYLNEATSEELVANLVSKYPNIKTHLNILS